MENKKTIVVSLGGSLIVPDGIAVDFLKDFISLIKVYIEKDFRFVLIAGGGKICRVYNKAVSEITSPSKEDLDWIGIATTKLNAELLRVSFGGLAYEKVITNPNEIPNTDKSIMIGSGWEPGCSSDNDAIIMAKNMNAKKVVNLSNIDFVYDSDPKINPNAQPIKEISWEDFREILPKEWNPGLNSPFDPIAAKHAQDLEIEVVIMNGKNIENLKNYLDGKEFVGTIIK
jgi:uridylate kinase